jgi:hypothetical protein
MDINLVTYCCPKDIHKLANGLKRMVESHKYDFTKVFVIKQDCRGLNYCPEAFDYPCIEIDTEDYQDIREKFNIPENDPVADGVAPKFYFESEAKRPVAYRFYWKNACTNPFIGLTLSDTEYTVFCDCDVEIRGGSSSWVDAGVAELKGNVIMVAPSYGQPKSFGNDGISQQCFVCKTERFRNIDYAMPFPENVSTYGVIFEGRLQRYMKSNNSQRCVLGPEAGILHHHAW